MHPGQVATPSQNNKQFFKSICHSALHCTPLHNVFSSFVPTICSISICSRMPIALHQDASVFTSKSKNHFSLLRQDTEREKYFLTTNSNNLPTLKHKNHIQEGLSKQMHVELQVINKSEMIQSLNRFSQIKKLCCLYMMCAASICT
ncbi:hypothetical protein XENOCAPTIV_016909 [Xenoophorus captivus]|uniref:Uncharacterized protein n=1 Tax=Xenoophorus captivus TaxID=1517983 RepID=A0ABV0QWR3_9TELE